MEYKHVHTKHIYKYIRIKSVAINLMNTLIYNTYNMYGIYIYVLYMTVIQVAFFFLQEDLLKQTNLQKNFLTKIYTTIHIITKQKTVN